MGCGSNEPKLIKNDDEFIKEWTAVGDCKYIIAGKEYIAYIDLFNQIIFYSKTKKISNPVFGTWNSIYSIEKDYITELMTDEIIPISNVACAAGGTHHEWLLCKTGNLFGRGSNKYKQLSTRQEENFTEFTLLFTNVVSVQACRHRSLIKVDDGKLVILGRFTPFESEYLMNYSDFKFALGWSSVALYKNKELFLIGKNQLGQIGTSDQTQKVNHIELEFSIDKVTAGSEHYLLLSNHSVYGWGWNEHYNFAIENKGNLTFQRINDGCIDIYCGPASSFIKTCV